MDINCYTAMTAAEFLREHALPARVGWMACHFSQRNTGLCDLPEKLPENAVLVLDDSTPPAGHDPELVGYQLQALMEKFHIQVVILDFQTPEHLQTAEMTAHLAKTLPSTVCIAAPYAQPHSSPVLIPAPAPHTPLSDHLAPWKGRQVWLEATLETEKITVTEQGSSIIPIPYWEPEKHWFTEEQLSCRYQIRELETQVEFTLTRDKAMLKKLMKKAQQQGVNHFIGLYQQLGPQFL